MINILLYGILCIALGVIFFFAYLFFRIKYLIRKTDKIISDKYKNTNIFPPETYTSPLLVVACENVYVLRPLPYWKIERMLQLIVLQYKDFNLDVFIKQDAFYPALAYILGSSRNNVDIMRLAEYLKNHITYKQILRILQVILLQNDVKTFVNIYEGLLNG